MKNKTTLLLCCFACLFAGCATTTTEIKEEKEASSVAESHELTLEATDNVYVLVRGKTSTAEIYRGTLKEGEIISREVNEPVDVLFTAGQHLTIGWDGSEFTPSTTGTAKISLD